ncbi:MAG: hypothetical protein LAP21_16175 [Acidobacteriia bacterium]|nr:hypothetical protein [Terriglobia bacterium]
MAFKTQNAFKVAGFVLLLMVAVLGLNMSMSAQVFPTGPTPSPWPLPAAVPPAPVIVPASQTVPPGVHDTGIIQYASLDATPGLCNKDDNPPPALSAASTQSPLNPPLPDQCKTTGGWIQLNNVMYRVPQNVVVVFPNTLITWEEMFELNPRTHQTDAVFESGLAMADVNRFPGTYEAHIDANIINGQHIAGLIFIFQEFANTVQGFIDSMDYVNGTMTVNNTKVQINDPKMTYAIPNPDGSPTGQTITRGRYSAGQSPDPRFTVDQGNPTVSSEIGYPMCMPVVAPGTYAGPELGIPGTPDPYVLAAPAGLAFTGNDDPQCPEINRPRDPVVGGILYFFTMNPAGAPPTADNPFPQDPYLEVPFEVGDFVTVIGTLEVDTTGAPFLSATSVVASLGTFTAPNTDPAYILINDLIQGTGGQDPAFFPQEAGVRTRTEGFTSDPQRTVDISAIDVDCNGNVTFRQPAWASNFPVELGPPGIGVKGRWRMRFPQGGDFRPASQNVGARISGAVIGKNKNGLDFGEYQLPTPEFIFPENQVAGNPPPPANFSDILFLNNGVGPLPFLSGVFDSIQVQLGIEPNPFFPNQLTTQLSPFPDVSLPPLTCTAGSFASVARATFSSTPNPPFAGVRVTLDGTASTPPNGPFTWTQIINPGDPTILAPGQTALGPTFTFPAPLVGGATNLTFQLVVGDGVAVPTSAPVTVSVPVIPPPPGTPPVIDAAATWAGPSTSALIAPVTGSTITVESGSAITLSATGVDPAGGTLSFTFTPDAAAVAAGIVVVQPAPGAATASFVAPQVPVLTAAQTFTFLVTGTSSVAPNLSGTATVTVIVNPNVDVITVSNVVYRRAKGRLIVNVSDFTPNVALFCTLDIINPATLQPYTGQMGPIIPFAPGIFSIRFSNIPPPGLVTITSSAGGIATSGITFLR